MPLIPIVQIAVLNRQRRELDPKKIRELATSIDSLGLLHPIVVRRPFDEEAGVTVIEPYVLCVGGRRLAAHMMLGRTHIEVNVKDDLDMLSAAIVELEENLIRQDISWQEQVDAKAAIHRLREQQNSMQTITQTAEELGETPVNVSRDLKLHRAMQLDPSLRKATSKASAVRMLEHKAHVAVRVKNIAATDLNVLAEKLVTADASYFIRTVRDKSVDLVFTDLPYMIDYFEQVSSGENMKSQYDDSAKACQAFIEDIVPEMVRVVKPTGWIVLFMGYEWHQWLQDLLVKAGTKPEMPPWIWNRSGPGNHGHYPELHASNRYDMLVVANGGQAKLLKKPVENILTHASLPSAERLHAMQKPAALCDEILDRCTLPGELVLDLCFGSGAHLASAARKGRDFLGCDINPENLPKALALVSENYKPRLGLVK